MVNRMRYLVRAYILHSANCQCDGGCRRAFECRNPSISDIFDIGGTQINLLKPKRRLVICWPCIW